MINSKAEMRLGKKLFCSVYMRLSAATIASSLVYRMWRGMIISFFQLFIAGRIETDNSSHCNKWEVWVFIILGAWSVWKHWNECVFKGATPEVEAAAFANGEVIFCAVTLRGYHSFFSLFCSAPAFDCVFFGMFFLLVCVFLFSTFFFWLVFSPLH